MKINIRNIHPNDEIENKEIAEKNYESCFVADLDGIVGYIISFPYILGKIYSQQNYDQNTNCHYIHELFIIEEFRNKGIATNLVETVLHYRANAFCVNSICCLEKFWNKFGFRSFFDTENQGKKSKYMILINNL